MILMTTALLGVLSGMMRSAFSVIIVAFLICFAFAAAALLGPVSFLNLGIALLGYNLGLAGLVTGHLVFTSAKSAN